ncbi:MAG TPA: hypothetical protein VMW81_09135 [Nitrospinota bacterium]|nr:hypothetical protein [Nitrospinota bacterium]
MIKLSDEFKKELSKPANLIQISILVILFITALILLENLFQINKQLEITEILNRPICAVKNVEIEPTHEKEYHLNITFMNFGKYLAENVSINWKCLIPETKKKKDGEKNIKPGETIISGSSKNITLLPQQEIKQGFYFFKKSLDGILEQIPLLLDITIEYESINNSIEQYSCSYLISKPKTFTGRIHTILKKSNLITGTIIPVDPTKNLGIKRPHSVSPDEAEVRFKIDVEKHPIPLSRDISPSAVAK